MTRTGHHFGTLARRAGLLLALLLPAFAGPVAAQVAPPDTTGILGVLRPGSGRPDPFTFVPDVGLDPLTVVQTRPIELTGFDGPLVLDVRGGIDVVVVHNDRAFRRRRTLVMPGDVVVLSARSPLDFGATVEVILSVGNYSTPWVISTRDQDRTPWAIAFPPTAAAAPGGLAVSEERLVRGFEGTIEARIAGPGEPRLRVNGGPWQPAAALAPGDRIQLSATTPAPGERHRIGLTVGELDLSWEVATTTATSDVEAPSGG